MKKFFNVNFIKKYRIEVAMAAVGIVLMTVSGNFVDKKDDASFEISNGSVENKTELSVSVNGYADNEAERLEKFLSDIKGVGSVDVIIYVSSTSKTVNATELNNTDENTEETDSGGGKRVNTRYDESVSYKIIKDKNGNESTVYVCEEYPEIKGIAVSAEGAGSNTVKEIIIDSVSKLYDIPVHKISVSEKNGK